MQKHSLTNCCRILWRCCALVVFRVGHFVTIPCPPLTLFPPPPLPLLPTPWGVYPLSIVYVKKMIIIYRIWDQKFHLPFPCPLLCVYVSKLQMTQTFPQAIIRHKNVQQMLCVCLGRTQCLIIGNFCLIKIANIIHMQYNLTLE